MDIVFGCRAALRRSVVCQSFEIFSRICYSSKPSNEAPPAPKHLPTLKPSESRERLPRIGDDGTAITLAGVVKPKDDQIFHAIGSIDELCSFIGLAREFAHDNNHPYAEYLKRIQTLLIDISVAISNCTYAPPNSIPAKPTATPSPLSSKGTGFSKRHVAELEEWIEEFNKASPPVEHFVIPGGGRACATLHVALSVCRRAERKVVPLVRDGDLDKEALVYLNRLALFLFTVSRVAAKLDEHVESVYTPKPSPSNSN